MRSEKAAAADAANIGGSQVGTFWTDSIPKFNSSTFARLRQWEGIYCGISA